MYTNKITEGIAKKLKKLYPDKRIEADAVSSNAFGKFFVMIINSNQKNGLGGTCRTDLTFDVSYVCGESENMEYNDWLKNMYSEFESIETDECFYRTKDRRGEKADGIYHFIFDVTARYRIITDNAKMSVLSQKGGMR